MLFSKSLIPAALTVSLLTIAGVAQSATQGSAGAVSNGTSTLSIGKLSNVQVSSIDDINLGDHAFLAAPALASDQICVFSSNTTYQITFDQSSGDFELFGATSGDTIPYSVTFTGGGVPAVATAGIPITGQVGNAVDTACLGTFNANYIVEVAAADFNVASPDNYSAVLELLVEPE